MRTSLGLLVLVTTMRGAWASEPSWPSVHARGLDDLGANSPRALYAFVPRPGVDAAEIPEEIRGALTPLYEIGHVERTSTGLLRVFERLKPRDEGVFAMRGFEPNASFVADTWWAVFGDRSIEMARAMRDIRETWLDANPRLELGTNEDDAHLDAGIQMWIPPPSEAPCRGIVLRMEALTANDYEAKALEDLAESGWAVIRLDTRARIDPPNRREILSQESRRQRRHSEILRGLVEAARAERGGDVPDELFNALYEQALGAAVEETPIPDSDFLWHVGDDAGAKGEMIARAVDVTLSQNAYAAEAAIDYVDAHRPDLAGRPVVIAGFSAGALAAPAAAARLGDRVKAMILVGGGADLLTIASTSNLTTGGLDLTPDGSRLAPEAMAALVESYRVHVQLDPYALAPGMTVPTLLILGMFDSSVPVATANILADRLEGEQRIDLPVDHKPLFLMLPLIKGRIAEWVRAAVPDGAREDGDGGP
ncbi:MAG: prolyl oligopeptidase family serine peptidase [Phycisphaeraceae bacterium]|nr:prolyl oligopeptidase family serine peptidase [Phycisphaeraceae bacterium]